MGRSNWPLYYMRWGRDEEAHAAATFTYLSPLVQSVVSAILFYEARDKNIIFAWRLSGMVRIQCRVSRKRISEANKRTSMNACLCIFPADSTAKLSPSKTRLEHERNRKRRLSCHHFDPVKTFRHAENTPQKLPPKHTSTPHF